MCKTEDRDVRDGRCTVLSDMGTKDAALNDHSKLVVSRVISSEYPGRSSWTWFLLSMLRVQVSRSHFVNIQ